MSTNASNIDSGLSGQPSDDIDKQRGPSSGSNAESPGSTLGTATTSVKDGNAASNQGSSGQSGPRENKGDNA
ncbi:unnamed protein product [Rotaria sp. Silwood1]|nr:unnamed protein product [Rotaria sp. Silwood1]CAF0866029.1 unnamed protein product [Rotaria sp. Silwood1]CAF0881517.1 unnamed protein product [Rotaria sp. Silwood1]CAF3357178.1 unnamed protein product [Rotaria sp. Silwood1]CAF3384423.1 unnamed protein product [Rotaria sp. Silwood1]